ncbi:MAG: type II secretion system F family protein [Thermodesulfobacteriota bacterium]|nr:type II secretion system F family protein [Thermodesulfobacteriota bacterium]
MPLYHYEAINTTGKNITGTHQANLVNEVESWLLTRGLTPIDIRVASGRDTDAVDSAAQKPSLIQRIQGVGHDDIIILCRQITTMLYAGVALLKALRIIKSQIKNPILRNSVMDIANRIEAGSSLSSAIEKYPKIFSQLFLNLIRVGEESGNLDNVFKYLAHLYENEKDTSERIKSVTRYPKILLSVMVLAILFLMNFVVPKFMTIFSSSKIALPLSTKILIFMSNTISENFFIIVLVITILIAGYRMALKNDEFELAKDRLTLRLPLLGDLAVKIHMSRFCRVFTVLTESGIDIIRTLELAASSLKNKALILMIKQVRSEVEEGADFHKAMSRHPQLPDMVVQMIAVGEEAGQIERMMAKVADFYEAETDYTIKHISSLIEPILLLGMGVAVGFIALAIFTPMWSMMEVMRG